MLCIWQTHASRCSSSRSSLTRQLTRKLVSQKSRRCSIRKPSKQRKNPINNGRLGRKPKEAQERHRKEEEKEKEKAKEDEQTNHKRKEEEDKLATAAAVASPLHKKKAVEGF